jgi:hypothetical protein
MFRTLANMATMKDLLTAAEQESLRDGDPDPGAEHVFLAALGMPDGSAQRAFARVGGTAASPRAAIDQHHDDALAAMGVTSPPAARDAPEPGPGRGVMRAKGSTRDLLRGMAEEAKHVHPSRFVSAHVVLAASSFELGTLSDALALLGVDGANLRAAALAELSEEE